MKIGKIVPNYGVIGNFILGQPISQVLFRLQSQPKSFGPINIIESSEQNSDVYLLLPSGFKFHFDCIYNRLSQIEIFTDTQNCQYTVPDMLLGPEGSDIEQAILSANSQQYQSLQNSGNDISIFSIRQGHPLTYFEIKQLYGATFQPKIKGDMVLLKYKGIKFLFKYEIPSIRNRQQKNQDPEYILDVEGLNIIKNKLVKVTIFDQDLRVNSDQISSLVNGQPISKMLRYKSCEIIPNEGINIYFEQSQAVNQNLIQMQKRIEFNQSLISVISTLGNPNKEYYKNEKLFLNYLELGIDIQIENMDYTVEKIIIQLNNQKMGDFCFYDRGCKFILKLRKFIEKQKLQPLESEIEEKKSEESDENMHESGIKTPPNQNQRVILKESITNELEEHLNKIKIKRDQNEMRQIFSQQNEQSSERIDECNDESNLQFSSDQYYTKEYVAIQKDFNLSISSPQTFQEISKFLQPNKNSLDIQDFYEKNYFNIGGFENGVSSKIFAFQEGILAEIDSQTNEIIRIQIFQSAKE